MSNQQPEALRLAEIAGGYTGLTVDEANQCATELLRLHAENEALRVDAERYRWLRKSLPAGQGSLTVTLDDRRNGCFNKPVFMESMDAAIDAARKEGGAA